MIYTAKNFSELLGTPGFSDQLLLNHFKLYEGYVEHSNQLLNDLNELSRESKPNTAVCAELKRRLGWEMNGMRLHEYYFGNMIKKSTALERDSVLRRKIGSQFGSLENWEKDFRMTGFMRGIGWAVVYLDPEQDKLLNLWINEHDAGHLAGGVPLLVMDLFEHAFTLDYGLKRADYIEAFFKAIHWKEVETRFESAQYKVSVEDQRR